MAYMAGAKVAGRRRQSSAGTACAARLLPVPGYNFEEMVRAGYTMFSFSVHNENFEDKTNYSKKHLGEMNQEVEGDTGYKPNTLAHHHKRLPHSA